MIEVLKHLVSQLDVHMQEVVRGASTAFVLKVMAFGLAFLFTLTVARTVGAEGAGIYFLAFTLTSVAGTISCAGLDTAVLRFVASGRASGDWVAVKGVYSKTMLLGASGSVLASAVMFMSAGWLAQTIFAKPELEGPLRWMALAVVPFAIFTLHAQSLQGLTEIKDAILVLNVAPPFFSLIGVLILAPGWGVSGVVWSYVGAALLASFLGLWRWRRRTLELRRMQGQFEFRELFRVSVPLFWSTLSTLVITWTPILFLGALSNSEAVGIFGAANRTAMLTSFVLGAVNSIAAPKFAALHQQGDLESLERTARISASIMVLVAGPILLLFFFVPKLIMQLFGEEFVAGAPVLSILAVGQFVNVATGSVAYLLAMSGYERLLRNILSVCAVANLILSFILINSLGLIGAATAAAVTVSSQNLLAMWLVWKKLRVCTLPLFRKS